MSESIADEPAAVLAKGAETAIARIKGIDDPDLLDAYLQAEVDRDDPRGDVIGAINQRKTDLRQHAGCPRGCDAPVKRRFDLPADDGGVQVKNQNATWHKTCIVPQEDGGVEVVLHGEPDAADAATEAADDAAPEPADQDAAASDDGPTGQSAKHLYDKLSSSDEAMTLASIQGWAGTELGLSPSEAQLAVDTLVNGGYADEIEDAVYTAS